MLEFLCLNMYLSDLEKTQNHWIKSNFQVYVVPSCIKHVLIIYLLNKRRRILICVSLVLRKKIWSYNK